MANTLAYSTKSELNRRKNIYEIQLRFCDHFWGQCDFCLKGIFSIDIFAVFLFIYFDSSQSGNEDITDNLILKLDFYTKRKKHNSLFELLLTIYLCLERINLNLRFMPVYLFACLFV